jgi:hypothetical protein
MDVMPGKAFLGAFVKFVRSVASRRERDVTNLQKLGDRKFKELERIHREFVERVIMLGELAQNAIDTLDKTDDFTAIVSKLKKGVDRVRKLREKEHDLRRERYEEAKAFEKVRLETTGPIHTIPQEVVTAIHVFLNSYSGYFENAEIYQHELDRTQRRVENAIDRLKKLQESPVEDVRSTFSSVLTSSVSDANEGEQTLRRRWIEVSRSYHELNAVMLRYGFPRREPTRKRLSQTLQE